MLPHRNTERLSYGRRAAGTAMEFDVPLNENARCLRSQGLENEAEMYQKSRKEKRRERREQREQRKVAEKRPVSTPGRVRG